MKVYLESLVMKQIMFSLALLTAASGTSLTALGQEEPEIGVLTGTGLYAVTSTGQKVECTKVEVFENHVRLTDSKGRKQNAVAHEKIKKIKFEERIILSLPITKGGKARLLEVHGHNDKHILASPAVQSVNSVHSFVYIYDRTHNLVETVKFTPTWDKKNMKAVDEVIGQYFGDCMSLMERLRSSMAAGLKYGAFYGVHNIKCGTKDLE